MEFVDFNPIFQRWTYADKDPETGEPIIREIFDKRHALATKDRVQLRNSLGLGKGEAIRHHVSIPPYVQVEMVNKYGVNLQDYEAVLKLVKLHYPHLIAHT